MNIGDKERERYVVPIQVPVPPEKKVEPSEHPAAEPAVHPVAPCPTEEPVHVDAPTGN